MITQPLQQKMWGVYFNFGSKMEKSLLEQKLKEKGFKPLPVSAKGKKFKKQIEEARKIVTKAVSETIDALVCLDYTDVIWGIAGAGTEVLGSHYGEGKVYIHVDAWILYKRGEKYLDKSMLEKEGILSMGFHEALKNVFDLGMDVVVHTGRADGELLYKDKEKMYAQLKEWRKITEVWI